MMRDGHAVTGRRLKWPAIIALLAALLPVSAVPGEARVRVFISPGIVVPFGPVWTHTQYPMRTPIGIAMPTHWRSSSRYPRSPCGTTVRTPKATTRMSHSAPAAGGRSPPRRHSWQPMVSNRSIAPALRLS